MKRQALLYSVTFTCKKPKGGIRRGKREEEQDCCKKMGTERNEEKRNERNMGN